MSISVCLSLCTLFHLLPSFDPVFSLKMFYMVPLYFCDLSVLSIEQLSKEVQLGMVSYFSCVYRSVCLVEEGSVFHEM